MYLYRQLEQAQHIGHLRARTANAIRQLVLGNAEFFQQLLVGVCLFQGVELHAVDVLQQSIAQQVVILGIAHDGRNRGQARLGGSAPTPLTHNELEATFLGRTNDHGLQQTKFADRVDELTEFILVEDRARLLRVGDDIPNGNLTVGRTDRSRGGLALLGGLRARTLLNGGSTLYALAFTTLPARLRGGITQNNIRGGIAQARLAGRSIRTGRDECG